MAIFMSCIPPLRLLVTPVRLRFLLPYLLCLSSPPHFWLLRARFPPRISHMWIFSKSTESSHYWPYINLGVDMLCGCGLWCIYYALPFWPLSLLSVVKSVFDVFDYNSGLSALVSACFCQVFLWNVFKNSKIALNYLSAIYPHDTYDGGADNLISTNDLLPFSLWIFSIKIRENQY